MDSDPFFAGLRGAAEFAKVREAGIACQQKFSSQWQRIQQQSSR